METASELIVTTGSSICVFSPTLVHDHAVSFDWIPPNFFQIVPAMTNGLDCEKTPRISVVVLAVEGKKGKI